MSLFNVGVSALNTAQLGLATTGHNISSVNTEGFHRQTIVQSAAIPVLTGSGFVGQGVQVDTITRVYSRFLDGQLLQAQTQGAKLDSYLTEVQQIDNMVADANTGLSPALQDFFKAVGGVSANPQSVPSRQALLSNSSALVSRFQTLAQRFTEIRDGINSQIASSVDQINSYAKQVAKLNEQIMLQTGGTGQPPNDLLDQRDTLVSLLSQQVGATTFQQGDSGINIYIGNGQPLVVGEQIFSLTTMPSPEDPQRTEVAFKYSTGNTLLGTNSLTGGSLGGLLDFRDTALDPAQNALGRVALGLAQSFNDQHKLGQDLAGNLGGDFFSVPPPTVISSTDNTGTAVISATLADVQGLTTSDYRIVFDGTNYQVTRMSDSTQTTVTPALMGSTTGVTVDGVTYKLESGTISTSDSFMIQPTRYAARDLALSSTINTTTVAAAAPIRTSAALANTGTGKISSGAVNSFNDTVTLTFNTPATTFDVVDTTTGATLATGVHYTSGDNISYNGWTTQITNGAGPTTPLAGDVFTVGKVLTSTTSATATIGAKTVLNPPVDPFLTNSVRVVFDTPTTYHLEGLTNNVSGDSSIIGLTTPVLAIPALSDIPNAGIVLTGGTATIGTGGAGSYASTGVTTTITGGRISGSYAGGYTFTGATVAVAGGRHQGTTTFSNATFTMNSAGTISILDGGSAMKSTFNTQSGQNSTFTGTSTVNGNTAPAPGVGLALDTALGAYVPATGVVLSGGTAAIGTGGAGAYNSTSTTTQISGGVISGPVGTVYTITGANLVINGGSAAASTTFTNINIDIDVATGNVSIPAVGGLATGLTSRDFSISYQPSANNLLSVNGWNATLSGAAAASDTFTIGANTNGVSDNRNALLLGQLQSQNTLVDGTTSLQGAYAQLVSEVGNKTAEFTVTSKAQQNLVAQTRNSQQALSGVNLDEEATNLMRYQQAYQAAGKMIQIASTLFDTLLAIK